MKNGSRKLPPLGPPVFDPRAAFGDPDSEETKRFRERMNLPPMQKRHDIKGMVRRDSSSTSIAAAHVVVRRVTKLQRRVLEAFRQHGPMTDEELERLPEFSEYGPTTVHKRRTELYQANRVDRESTRRNSRGIKMTVWNLTPQDSQGEGK
jgi:hypothetical protein